MFTIFNYAAAFWSVVVVNCVKPVNWKYCYRIDQWLLPEIHQGIQIYLDREHKLLYKSEREYLKNL